MKITVTMQIDLGNDDAINMGITQAANKYGASLAKYLGNAVYDIESEKAGTNLAGIERRYCRDSNGVKVGFVDVKEFEPPSIESTRADKINQVLNLMDSPSIVKITTEQTGGGVVLDYVLLTTGEVLVVGVDSISLYGSQDMAYNEPYNTIWEHGIGEVR